MALHGAGAKCKEGGLWLRAYPLWLSLNFKKNPNNIIVLMADQAPDLKDAREYKKMCFMEIRSNVSL